MTIAEGRRSSLMVRMTASYVAVLACLTMALGTYFYHSVRRSQEQRIETIVAGRASYFARLVHEMYSLDDLRARPLLIASMLGAERDLLIFRRPSGEVLIRVGPEQIALPPLGPTSPTTTMMADGVSVYWGAAQTTGLQDGSPVEVLAGHPMTNEQAMLAAYRERIVLATLVGIGLAALLALWLLHRSLRPLHDMATKAAAIHPGRLDLRLDPQAAPAELHRLAVAVDAMLDRLADGYARLSQFSADLAHEIRTPLGILIGQTQVTLAQSRTAEDYCQILESNLEEFERLHRLSENMLFLARADHGQSRIEHQAIDLGRELPKIADYFEGLALERQMSFALAVEGVVTADPDLFRRAVGNLVANAISHGTAGTVIGLRAMVQAGEAVVEVENHGEPIAPEQQGRLFDRFYQIDSARSGARQSHGLGLAIVAAIMHLHGGRAGVTCSDDGLLCFRLHFPTGNRP